jgi:DNA-binding response OmpR family regulator
MMIDDDQSILNIITRILEIEGETAASANVREVLDRLQESKPNLVIMDIETPDLSSPEVVERLRDGSGTPALMLTARCDVTTVRDALAACTGRNAGQIPSSAGEDIAGMLSMLRKAEPGTITQN